MIINYCGFLCTFGIESKRLFTDFCLLGKNNCVCCLQLTGVVEVYNKGVMATLSRGLTALWPGTGNE